MILVQIQERTYSLKDYLVITLRCNPWAASFIVLQNVAFGLLPTLQVLITARFLDQAIQVYQGVLELREVFSTLLLLVFVLGYQQVGLNLTTFATTKLRLGIRKSFRTAITERRAHLAYYHVENAATWDLIQRVAAGSEEELAKGFHNLIGLGANCLRVVGLFSLLFSQAWWAALIILAFSVPLFALGIKGGKASYEVDREVAKFRRKHDYLSEVLLGRESVDERALFSYGSKLNAVWLEVYEQARILDFRTRRKWFLRMKGGTTLTALTSVLIVAVLLNPVLAGAISVGMFIALAQAVFGLVDLASWQFVASMDQLARSQEYFKDLTQFANLESSPNWQDMPLTPAPEFRSLEFINVRFAYPGTEALILNGLSFTIEAGLHYAFVGVNGAGKTTITKLILGLYDNYSGEILLNGRSLREHTPRELKAIVNVFYQDFARYYVTLGENIALGNPNHTYDPSALKVVADKLELTEVIQNLPQGLDTPLGKIRPQGQDLSGGEWQRVAMARAIYNPAPLRILDEPTAALDPLAESHLYQKFEEISQGTTTIFISHRLGSTKLADRIFVIEAGKLQEEGTHQELMDRKGIYQEMYESQRGWYS